MVATCGSCWKVFQSGHARGQHMDATGHDVPEYECDTCFNYFQSRTAVFQHMNSKNHFQHKCRVCDRTWPTKDNCKLHEQQEHLFCRDHGRRFQNANNLRMHLNSNSHRPATLGCPMCKAKFFSTATGLLHHLERGSCPNAPHLNRDEVYKIVRRCNPHSTISKNLLEWHGSPTYEATSSSWNHRLQAYQCCLCNKAFNSLKVLTQHMNSSVHQQAFYHCPGRSCNREFATLAAIANHLESESCGFTRFETVRNTMEGIVSGDRLLTFA